MKGPNFIIFFCITILIGLGAYFFFFQKAERTAFFYNQKVFDQFNGKLELESKLKIQTENNKKALDSLMGLIQNGRTDLSPIYTEKLQRVTADHQELSERYTADIWKYINDEVSNFGREKEYDYIFGASGNGSLMYADSSRDITNAIVLYLNQKYKTKN